MPDASADQGDDRVGTITRLTIAADFAEAFKQVLRGLDALRAPVTRPSRSNRQQPALVVHRDYPGGFAQCRTRRPCHAGWSPPSG